MRLEETSDEVRLSAVTAMLNTLYFISNNMKNEIERNYILKVILENTQNKNSEVKERSFQCLCDVADCYYEYLPPYMQQIFGVKFSRLFFIY